MSHIIFQAPAWSDVTQLAQLARDTFVDTFGHLYTHDNLHLYLRNAYSEENIQREMHTDGVAYQVAIDQNRLIAYCKISHMTLPVTHHEAASMELRQLYVRKAYWGSGVADQFMHWVFEQAQQRAVQSVYLGVYSDNLRAQRFYARYGFLRISEYHFMVGEHADLEFILHRPML